LNTDEIEKSKHKNIEFSADSPSSENLRWNKKVNNDDVIE
jgi:hypothetical protein